jgi:MFS family permease
LGVTDEQTEQQAASSPDVEADGRGQNGKTPAPSPAPAATAKRGGLAVLKVLRHREFAWFWGGQAISLVGTWMQNFAQSWVVTGITHTAMALGLVNFMMSIPTLVLMPLGGVAADRVERRKILIYTQWLMLVLALIMGALVAANRLQIWHVYVIAVLSGVATAYELPSYQSFYPQLVDKEDLTQAISLNQATFHASRIIGPGLAAWFVALWGTAAAFYANAASFLFVIGGLLMIRPRPPANANKGGSAKNFMGEGFRYVKSRPELGSLLGITGITTLFIFPNLAVLMPFYAKHILATDAKGLGWIMAVSGFGSFIGAGMLLSVAPAARIRHHGHDERHRVGAKLERSRGRRRSAVVRDRALPGDRVHHGAGRGPERAARPGDEPLFVDVHGGDAVRGAADHRPGGRYRNAVGAARRGDHLRHPRHPTHASAPSGSSRFASR